MVARVAEAEAVGVKVKIERGFGPTAVWPIHAPEIRAAIAAAARSHELPVYVHAFSEEEQRIALEMGAYALVHGGFIRSTPSDEHVERLRTAGTWVISTLSISDAARLGLEPQLLDAPHVRLSVPEAIEASTRLPAEMIGVADEIGTVEVGKRADLVILPEDPLADLSVLTRPMWIVKDGEARTPAGWMSD